MNLQKSNKPHRQLMPNSQLNLKKQLIITNKIKINSKTQLRMMSHKKQINKKLKTLKSQLPDIIMLYLDKLFALYFYFKWNSKI